MDATLDLQQSVFKALLQDPVLTGLLGSNKVFDHVPERVAFPYVVIGRSTTADWSTSTEDGETVVFFVHVWSRSRGRAQSHAIQEAIKRRLSNPLLVLTDHHLIHLRFQLAETRRDRISGHLHGLLRFRGVTEPRL